MVEAFTHRRSSSQEHAQALSKTPSITSDKSKISSSDPRFDFGNEVSPATVEQQEAIEDSKAAGPHVPLADVEPGTELINSKEERKLVRKLDSHMFPCLCILYMLNHLDRTSFANARIGGMKDDLHLSSNDYSVAILIFFVGYILLQIPSNMILSRMRPSLYLPGITLGWGIIVALASRMKTKNDLILTRLFLGCVESGFFPGVLLVLSSWYRKAELAKRIGILCNAGILSGAFGGILSGSVIHGLDGVGGLRGWRWLFLIEGIAAIVASIVVIFFLPDWPADTKWLSEKEKALAVSRLEVEQVQIDPCPSNIAQIGHLHALAAAMKDWRTYLLSFMYLMLSSSQTILYFIPSIIAALGYHGSEAQFMTIPPYVAAWVLVLVVSISADYFEERMLHVAIPMALAGLFYALCLPISAAAARYTLVCLAFGGTYGALPVVSAWVSDAAGFQKEKRAITLAIVNTVCNVSTFYGSFLWPEWQEPKFVLGFSTVAAFCFCCALSAAFTQFLMRKFPQRWKPGYSLANQNEQAKSSAASNSSQ